jgi:hypothetical protein
LRCCGALVDFGKLVLGLLHRALARFAALLDALLGEAQIGGGTARFGGRGRDIRLGGRIGGEVGHRGGERRPRTEALGAGARLGGGRGRLRLRRGRLA